MLPQRLLNLLRDKNVTLTMRYDRVAKVFVARLEMKSNDGAPRLCSVQHVFRDEDVRVLGDRIVVLCGDMDTALGSGKNEAGWLGGKGGKSFLKKLGIASNRRAEDD